MPPKKKRKPRPTQSQKQSQRVTVNIGSTKSAPRKKKSGGGGSRQPSTYSHNLAPTFITAPPVDYTPLLAMMQHHAQPIVEQQPIAQTQTPLSSVTQATAQQMPGIAAEERRAGHTAGSFQPPPSISRISSEVPSLSRQSSVTSEMGSRLAESIREADTLSNRLLSSMKPEPLSSMSRAGTSALTEVAMPPPFVDLGVVREEAADKERERITTAQKVRLKERSDFVEGWGTRLWQSVEGDSRGFRKIQTPDAWDRARTVFKERKSREDFSKLPGLTPTQGKLRDRLISEMSGRPGGIKFNESSDIEDF